MSVEYQEVVTISQVEGTALTAMSPPGYLEKLIFTSLEEDASWGDPLGAFLGEKQVKFKILAKSEGILCGLGMFIRTFKALEEKARFWRPSEEIRDGYHFRPGELLLLGESTIRTLSIAERTALNFLIYMSGIATRTREMVSRLRYPKLLDTRKTLPNLRRLQKYAFIIGGGSNHRWNLSELIMVKDTHKAIKHLSDIISSLRGHFPIKPIEIEVEDIEELSWVLSLKPDIIMLDNFPPDLLRKAVERIKREAPDIKVEASGGITPENISSYDIPGLDFISTSYPFYNPSRVDLSVKTLFS